MIIISSLITAIRNERKWSRLLKELDLKKAESEKLEAARKQKPEVVLRNTLRETLQSATLFAPDSDKLWKIKLHCKFCQGKWFHIPVNIEAIEIVLECTVMCS